MTAPACPHVYRAINRIIAAFAKEGIPRNHFNLADQYPYRSIDDVLERLAPLLARHRLCVLPRVLERTAEACTGEQDRLLTRVQLLVAFDLVSARDGSCHVVQGCGEALDASDKGTAKAMSAAWKSAMLELFCIPVGSEEPDASSHRLKRHVQETEPVQGWAAWGADIIDIASSCETLDALDRLRTRQQGLLEALKREQPDLYARVGEAFGTRGQQLASPKPAKASRRAKPAKRAESNRALEPPRTLETVDA